MTFYKKNLGGRKNQLGRIVPIGLDIDSENVPLTSKGPVYAAFRLYDHISAFGKLVRSWLYNTMLNQVSFDETRRYGIKNCKDVQHSY